MENSLFPCSVVSVSVKSIFPGLGTALEIAKRIMSDIDLFQCVINHHDLILNFYIIKSYVINKKNLKQSKNKGTSQNRFFLFVKISLFFIQPVVP